MSGYAAKVLAAQPPTYVVFDTAIRDTAASHEEEFRELVAMGGVRECADAAELAAFIGCATAEIEGTLAAARAAAAGERSDEFRH
jgi:fumarate reductase flavoprotein subunit